MQKFRSRLHLSPLHISLTLPQNAFGQIQYFEAPDEELPHYCDLTDEPPTLDEDEELPNYSEIEPTVNLSKIITVKVWGTEITSDSPLSVTFSPSLPPSQDFKTSRVEKSLSDEWEIRRCSDNRIFYYDPINAQVMKRHPSRLAGAQSSKHLAQQQLPSSRSSAIVFSLLSLSSFVSQQVRSPTQHEVSIVSEHSVTG
jgi:hypothetical protein